MSTRARALIPQLWLVFSVFLVASACGDGGQTTTGTTSSTTSEGGGGHATGTSTSTSDTSSGGAGGTGGAASGGAGGTGGLGGGGASSGGGGAGGAATTQPIAKLLVVPKRLVTGTNTVVLDASGSTGDPYTVLWKPDRGSFVAGTTAASPVATLEVDGALPLPIALEVTNAFGTSLASIVVPLNQPPSAIIAGNLITTMPGMAVTLDASGSNDPDGDPLSFAWSLQEKPAFSAAAASGVNPNLPFTPDVAGVYVLHVVVSDGAATSSASRAVWVQSSDDTPPEATLSASPNIAAAGTPITLFASATDNVAVQSLTLTVDGQALMINGGTAMFTPPTVGLYTAKLVAADAAGLVDTAEVDLFVHAPGAIDNPNLSVDITSPDDGAELKKPTDLLGTAQGNNFAGYKIEARPHRPLEKVPTPYRLVAKGKTAVAPGGLLGAWDTTLFENDTYEVRLTAWDGFGHGLSTERAFVLVGKRKIGALRFSMVDAKVQAGPVPFQVVRAYSSFDNTTTDFGVGWSMSIGTAKLKQTTTMGKLWSVSCPLFGTPTITPLRAHKITLELGTDTYRFAFVPDQASCFGGFGSAKAKFVALPGTSGTLVPDGSLDLSISSGSTDITQGGFGAPAYDPTGFTLTTRDKFVLHITQAGKIDQITDPSGNVVMVTEAGIVHGGVTELAFTRDAVGRILSMALPDGTSRTYDYDGNGDLVGTVDFEGKPAVFTYDGEHHITGMYGPSGRPLAHYEYDADGRLIAIVDGDGKITVLDHDIVGQQEVVTDRLGNPFIYVYDDEGNVIQATDPLGFVRSATYDAEGRPLTITNEMGKATTYAYDAFGQTLSVTDPIGRTTSFAYNPAGNLLEKTDPKGQKETYAYDAAERLTLVTHPDGSTRAYSYDPTGKLLSATPESGETHTLSYGANGVQTGFVDGEGTAATFTANTKKQLTGKSYMLDTGAGVVSMTTAQTYNIAGFPQTITTPEGATTTLSYNEEGTPSGYEDAEGLTASVTVNANGIGTKLTNPGGSTMTIVRDANDEAVQMVSSDGSARSRKVDVLGRVLEEKDGAGNVTQRAYDPAGRLISVTSPQGGATEVQYDDGDRITKITGPDNASMTFAYDQGQTPVSVTDALGQTITRQMDAAGRTLSITAPGNLVLLQRTYDSAGRTLTETDGSGRTRGWMHSPYGVTGITDGAGATTTMLRNAAGDVIAVTDALGRTTSFEVDSAGYLLSVTAPSGAKSMTTYTPARRIQDITDADGATIVYFYDASGRIVRREASDGTFEELMYSSKLDGPPDAIKTQDGITSIGRDADGRITQVTFPNGQTISYKYDKDRRTEVTTALGTTKYEYDTSGRMTKGIAPNGKTLLATYDGRGKLNDLTYPNGVKVSYAYDLATGWPTSISAAKGATPLWGETYVRDGAGRVLTATEQSGRVRTYGYDLAGRLTSESVTMGATETTTYAYDAVGNRTAMTDKNGTKTWAYNDDNQLVSDGTYTYEYDASGKRTKRTGMGETLTFAYDGFDRLASVARAGGAGPALTTYKYDAFGAVRARIVDGAEEKLLNDPADGLPVVLEQEGATGTMRNVFRPGSERGSVWGRVPVSGSPGAEAYPLQDGLDSVRVVTGAAGESLGEIVYGAFGTEAAAAVPEMPFRFAGERLDPATGLYDLRARAYDPRAGRFLTRDILLSNDEDPTATNAYPYAKNDPVNHVDPTGHLAMLGYLVGLDQGQKGADAAAALLSTALINIGMAGISAFDGSTSTGLYSSSAGDFKTDLIKIYLGKLAFDDGASFVYPQADFTMMPFKGLGQITLNYKLVSLFAIGEAINIPNEYFWEGVCLWSELANKAEGGYFIGVQAGQWIMSRFMMMPYGALHGWAAGGLNKVRSKNYKGGTFVGTFGVFNGLKISIGAVKNSWLKLEGKVGLGVHGPPGPFTPFHAHMFDHQFKAWPVSKPKGGGPNPNDGA